MLLALAFAPTAAASPAPEIPFTKYELPNGLDVTLAPDASIPFVCTNLWYDVGSKDEVAGRSGFAHLFEHLMFQGSVHHDDEYFAPLQPLGARLNGSTTLDRTNYYECLPSEQLPLALFLEADRMGWLLPALTPAKLQNQKDVVRNERRQNYDNPPYGQAWLELLAGVFPDGHPYHIATIGKHEEIEAATLEDVSAFFRQWYTPNNASLVIAGDFDDQTARKLVESYFGPVPRGPDAVHTPPSPVVFDKETRVRRGDDVAFDKVWIAWPSPAVLQPGDAELDLLASALSDGKDSRLYKALVHDQRIAQDVSARQNSLAYQSFFLIEATASEGHSGDELVAAIDKVLEEARTSGISAEEVEIGRLSYEVQFFGGLTSIQGKADLLNGYNIRTGDPGFLPKDLARYQAASAESVSASLRSTLDPKKRFILTIGPEPAPPPSDGAPPPATPAAATPAAKGGK
jgi:zinc protease